MTKVEHAQILLQEGNHSFKQVAALSGVHLASIYVYARKLGIPIGRPGCAIGTKRTLETRAKMSEAQRGRKHSEETKAKIRAWNQNRKTTSGSTATSQKANPWDQEKHIWVKRFEQMWPSP